MSTQLFFVAIIPPPEIRTEVNAFKRYAAAHFRSKRALNSPPHITLFPPFRFPPARSEDLKSCLRDFSDGQDSFYIRLSGFDAFIPRVIFVDVELNDDLKQLQSGLKDRLLSDLQLSSGDRRDFHPHMTVAFKDLRKSVFPLAWEHFSQIEYERLLKVDAIHLLRHSNRRWRVDASFPLG